MTGRAIVEAWQAAITAGDLDTALRLTSPDVEVGGPQGTAHGHAMIQAWVERTHIALTPLQTEDHGDAVVVGQRAAWRNAEGEVTSEATIATVFRLRNGVIVSLHRYDDFESALQSLPTPPSGP